MAVIVTSSSVCMAAIGVEATTMCQYGARCAQCDIDSEGKYQMH
jgi:hypothetical protein